MKIEIDITDQMPELVEFIRDQSEIDLDLQQVADLFSKETSLVADIGEWGWEDTAVKSRIIDVVTQRFLGRGWPTYGEQVHLSTFINQLRNAAEVQGFKTLQKTIVEDEIEFRPTKLSPEAQALVKQRFQDSPQKAPFIAVLVHADGRREEMLFNGWT